MMENLSLLAYVKQMRKRYDLTQVDFFEREGGGLRFVCDFEQVKQTLRKDKVNQVLILFGAELVPAPMDRYKLEL